MTHDDGLVCAYLRGGDGRWVSLAWDAVLRWRPDDGLLWVHLDRAAGGSRAYLTGDARIDPLAAESLLAEETRPRAATLGAGSLVILRGVNLNPGADPEDMVAIRCWIARNRVITTRHRRVVAVNDIREQIDAGHGPADAGGFLVLLAQRLLERMAPVIEGLEDTADELEDDVVTGDGGELRARLAVLRRQAISLRRYLAPQREAMSRLCHEPPAWLAAGEQLRLRELADRVTRHVEDLDAIRERASVIQDEVANRASEQMNRNMYLLALVATVLLPASFLTGLLGVNIDGLPFAKDSPWAFWVLAAMLGGLIALEIYLVRRLKWL